MALPSSGPISGSQIGNELSLPAVNLSLSGMIASSSISNTNPDKYSEFYGYSNLTVFYTSITQPKPVFACDIALINTYYHNGSGLLPVVGDIVYQSNQTTVDAGINRGMSTLSSGSSFQVYTPNGSGVVTAVLNCIN